LSTRLATSCNAELSRASWITVDDTGARHKGSSDFVLLIADHVKKANLPRQASKNRSKLVQSLLVRFADLVWSGPRYGTIARRQFEATFGMFYNRVLGLNCSHFWSWAVHGFSE
jgi:hypothetical protein